MNLRAQRRILKLKTTKMETPCNIPSYSSRAVPPDPLQDFLDKTLKDIKRVVLLSAYDLQFRASLRIDYDVFAEIDEAPASAVLLDSGGYEEIWNRNAENAGIIHREGRPGWSKEQYYDLLRSWESKTELIAATYDDDTFLSMPEQIDRARAMADQFPRLTVDFLLKPIKSDSLLEITEIAGFARDLSNFSLIGVTEKEIGKSMSERIIFLSELRDCLTSVGIDIPIHVFGGLEPSMTILYFMAGADIFDGLSWLRYAFTSTNSQYAQSYLSVSNPNASLASEVWNQRKANLGELFLLEDSMGRLADGSSIEDAFGIRSQAIRRAWNAAWNGV